MSDQLVQITRVNPSNETKPLQMDIDKIESPVLRRLIDEIRNEEWDGPSPYNRWHNRHNRSR